MGVYKFGITGKWRICCVWNNGQDFDNLKNSCAKGCYMIQKLEPVIGRVYLPQCFGSKYILTNVP